MGEHRVDVGRKQPDGKNSYKVTFEVPAEVEANQAQVCGEFNDWSATATPMTRRKDGSFAETITLEAGQRYRYRYLVDGNRWENDWTADDYVANECGGDSVVEV
jgi:1,4-alpha-glucan branching enzyme